MFLLLNRCLLQRRGEIMRKGGESSSNQGGLKKQFSHGSKISMMKGGCDEKNTEGHDGGFEFVSIFSMD